MIYARSLSACVAIFLVACCGAATAEEEERQPTGVLFYWPNEAKPQGGTPGRDEPLESDRPDFIEAPCTVGAGQVQIEMGYTLYQDRQDGTRFTAHSFPETLYRIGLFEDWFELRIGWNYSTEGTTTLGDFAQTISGSEDLYVGVKLGLTPQQGWAPEMVIIPQMTIPLGGPFSNDRVLPGLNWIYSWDINDIVSTTGSTQGNAAVDELDAAYFEFIQAWTINYVLAEKFSAYTEWFMFTPLGSQVARTEHYMDGGFKYAPTNNLQFDIRAGKGISEASLDYFVGIGAVVRF